MAHLRLPLTANGLTLPVMIGLPAPAIISLKASGQPLPAPITVRGVIDTGTDVTAVAPNLLLQLGATPTNSTTTQTVGGSIPVDLYEISLSIHGTSPSTGIFYATPTLLVIGLPSSIPAIDLLLGRDVLDECILIYDGPGRDFLLLC